MATILVVDEDSEQAGSVGALCPGHVVIAARDASAAMERFDRGLQCDVVVTELDFDSGLTGFALVEAVAQRAPDVPIVVVTRRADVASRCAALARGALAFVPKAADPDALGRSLGATRDEWRARRKPGRDALWEGCSPWAGQLRAALPALARDRRHLLIAGEVGAGKSRIANAILQMQRFETRVSGVECSLLHGRDYAWSALFGQNPGGGAPPARRRAEGGFERATKGTLLLESILSLGRLEQTAVAMAMREHVFVPLGASGDREFRGRVIATASLPYRGSLEDVGLMDTLVDAFDGNILVVPPLRCRPDDLPHLVRTFLAQEQTRQRAPTPAVPEGVWLELLRHEWVGNVRELRTWSNRLVASRGRDRRLFRSHEWSLA